MSSLPDTSLGVSLVICRHGSGRTTVARAERQRGSSDAHHTSCMVGLPTTLAALSSWQQHYQLSLAAFSLWQSRLQLSLAALSSWQPRHQLNKQTARVMWMQKDEPTGWRRMEDKLLKWPRSSFTPGRQKMALHQHCKDWQIFLGSVKNEENLPIHRSSNETQPDLAATALLCCSSLRKVVHFWHTFRKFGNFQTKPDWA